MFMFMLGVSLKAAKLETLVRIQSFHAIHAMRTLKAIDIDPRTPGREVGRYDVGSKVAVYDVLGRKVKYTKELPKGVYFMLKGGKVVKIIKR